MNPKTQHTIWQGPNGDIEVSIDQPNELTSGLAVIAHPHPLFGGTKDNKVVQTIARALLQLGFVTVRFNFRGVGQSEGQHDGGTGESEDMAWLVERAHGELLKPESRHLPVALAGFSFGAFVTTHTAKQLSQRATVKLGKMVLVGTATSRFSVAEVPTNTLVIHGEVDDTVPLDTVLDWARPQELPVVVMPGVEHFFHGKLPNLKDIITRYYPT